MSILYVDTSALAKRYANEARSDEVDAFLQAQDVLLITTLTTVEMRSLLGRRRRSRELSALDEMKLFSSFSDDVRQGHITEHDVSGAMFRGAVHIMGQLPELELRTLDALHLAAGQELGANGLATADARMRDAAVALSMNVSFFG